MSINIPTHWTCNGGKLASIVVHLVVQSQMTANDSECDHVEGAVHTHVEGATAQQAAKHRLGRLMNSGLELLHFAEVVKESRAFASLHMATHTTNWPFQGHILVYGSDVVAVSRGIDDIHGL